LSAERELVDHSQAIPLDCGEPAFAAPWEAQAFAMTLKLHENGLFSWPEWAEALGAEISAAGPHSPPSDYYRLWLCALEKLCSGKALISPDSIRRRQAQWREAAAATPHGQPIVLADKG
jgi:nitrile hydratase accessory protein